jgi:2-oxoglutarate ferredoxin oxidoreductase subunit beta
MDLKIILFNNQIYGLTKGQYSPTSAPGTRAPSTPTGSIDHPLNPISLALGSGATFVARCADTDAKLMGKILEEAYRHKGAVFIEILQNCPVFNDGVWEAVKDDPANRQLILADGKPLVFAGGSKGIRVGPGMTPEVVDIKDGDIDMAQLLVHSERGSQVQDAIEKQGPGDLTKLMYSGMVWEVGADGTRH